MAGELRAEFERWYASKYDVNGFTFERHNDKYRVNHIEICWQAFKYGFDYGGSD